MLKFNKEDYELFFPLLDEEKQKVLIPVVINDVDSMLVDDENLEIDLYEWINDLVVEKGFNEKNEINSTGKRLEKVSDYIFSVIEE